MKVFRIPIYFKEASSTTKVSNHEGLSGQIRLIPKELKIIID